MFTCTVTISYDAITEQGMFHSGHLYRWQGEQNNTSSIKKIHAGIHYGWMSVVVKRKFSNLSVTHDTNRTLAN